MTYAGLEERRYCRACGLILPRSAECCSECRASVRPAPLGDSIGDLTALLTTIQEWRREGLLSPRAFRPLRAELERRLTRRRRLRVTSSSPSTPARTPAPAPTAPTAPSASRRALDRRARAAHPARGRPRLRLLGSVCARRPSRQLAASRRARSRCAGCGSPSRPQAVPSAQRQASSASSCRGSGSGRPSSRSARCTRCSTSAPRSLSRPRSRSRSRRSARTHHGRRSRRS